MTKCKIVLHSEALARIVTTQIYKKHGLYEAMKLCQTYTGRDAKDAYKTVMAWVEVSNKTSCEACKYRPRCDEIGNDWNCLEWSRSMTDGDYHQETEGK